MMPRDGCLLKRLPSGSNCKTLTAVVLYASCIRRLCAQQQEVNELETHGPTSGVRVRPSRTRCRLAGGVLVGKSVELAQHQGLDVDHLVLFPAIQTKRLKIATPLREERALTRKTSQKRSCLRDTRPG